MKRYPDVDPRQLGALYTEHVEAMTTEGLHGKSTIAAQLALRDKRNQELATELDALQGKMFNIEHALLDNGCDCTTPNVHDDLEHLCLACKIRMCINFSNNTETP